MFYILEKHKEDLDYKGLRFLGIENLKKNNFKLAKEYFKKSLSLNKTDLKSFIGIILSNSLGVLIIKLFIKL
jgi:hypothetical protein